MDTIEMKALDILYPDGFALHNGQLSVNGKEVANTDKDIKVAELQAEHDALAYSRNRQAEYPSIGELTVALYDTDDKAALETKRAAIKTKWPKDNSGPVE